MIDSIFLHKVHKCGDIASQIEQLYDKKRTGQTKSVLVGSGNILIDVAIKFQEERIEHILQEIQKGYKTSGVEK